MSILVINAGSTSLKFGIFDAEARATLSAGSLDWVDGDRQHARLVQRHPDGTESRARLTFPDHRAGALSTIERVARENRIDFVGHRVVHGGTALQESRWIDGPVKAAIARVADLAPLHNPPALEAIEAAEAALPGVPQIAVFDTAFFAPLPATAHLYALPYEWHARYGVRRIGFHGISNAYCAGRAAELLGRADLRLVTCHLGGGCSATAVRGGAPVATTMGFTPMEGLMMSRRSGSVDPGLLIHLQRHGKLTVEELDHALNHCSGLLGLSGLSANITEIEAAMVQGHDRARLAFDLFADHVRRAVGSLAVTLGGVDALVFTAGIGEGSARLREAACQGLECLGLRLDSGRNAAAQPDADIATSDSPGRILVIRTREDLLIAREVRRMAGGLSH